jgi:hypothetical protein
MQYHQIASFIHLGAAIETESESHRTAELADHAKRSIMKNPEHELA